MRLALAAALVLAVTSLAGAAIACSCIAYRSAAEQFAAAELMFKGRVLSQARAGEGAAVTTFRVAEVLKGRAGRTVTVRHTLDGASCGVTFRPGAAALVIAHRRQDRGWSTGLCSAPRFPEGDYRRAARGEPVPTAPPEM